MRCALLAGVGLALLLAGAAAAQMEVQVDPLAEEEAATAEQLRAEQRARFEAEMRRLPDLGEFSLERVVQLRVEDGDLVARTSLPEDAGRGRIAIPELPGLTTVHVLRRPHNWPAEASPPFQLIHRSLSEADLVETQTSIFYGPGFMNISRDVQTPARVTSVQLIQAFRPIQAVEAEHPVRLFVQSFDTMTDERGRNLSLTAESFESLRRNHPREVSEYLEPVFRDLRADGLIAVDLRAAWQVFADRYQPDEQLTRQVREILTQLDAEAFEQRQAASETLERLGQPAALVLLGMDRSDLSPEQNTRIDAFLREYRPLDPQQQEQMRRDTAFLLSVLLAEPRPLRAAALEQLRALHDGPVEFDLDAPAEQRLAMVAELRRQLPSE